MLKRHQILLEDWQSDLIRALACEKDWSITKVLRALVCKSVTASGNKIINPTAQYDDLNFEARKIYERKYKDK